MGAMMISLDDRHEQLLRQLAIHRYGGRKGALSKVMEAALDREAGEDAHMALVEKAVAEMREGIYSAPKGWKPYEHRSELYDR